MSQSNLTNEEYDEMMLRKASAEVDSKLRQLEIEPDHVNRANDICEKLYSKFPTRFAKEASKTERDNRGLDDGNLIYGEIHVKSFALTIEKLKHKYGGLKESGGLFVDIGCGTGKAVFAALLLHEFDKVMGIEILRGLHDVSLQVVEDWNRLKLSLDIPERTRKAQVEMIHGDILQIDWSQASLVFCNSTCFDSDLMEKVTKKTESMKIGSYFISFTRKLESTNWEILENERLCMSWGSATVFIHKRIGNEPQKEKNTWV